MSAPNTTEIAAQPTPAPAAPEELEVLERRMVEFVRAFGLLEPDTTPCGQPMTTSEAHAMTALATDGARNQRDLVDRLRLEKSTISRLVTKLEQRGWVRREPDPTDGRAVRLLLTERGHTIAGQVAAARRQRLGRLLDAIPPDDRARVLGALEILGDAAHAH